MYNSFLPSTCKYSGLFLFAKLEKQPNRYICFHPPGSTHPAKGLCRTNNLAKLNIRNWSYPPNGDRQTNFLHSVKLCVIEFHGNLIVSCSAVIYHQYSIYLNIEEIFCTKCGRNIKHKRLSCLGSA